jgi:hypothetical protein
VCGHSVEESLPKLGHLLTEWKEVQKVSCEQKGIWRQQCTRCQKLWQYETPGPEHKFTSWMVHSQAFCGVEGLKSHTCQWCGLVEEQILPARKHWFYRWEIITPATCQFPGEKQRTCRRCGAVEQAEIEQKKHRPGKWEIIKKARPYHKGIRQKNCKVCGEVLAHENYLPSLQSMAEMIFPAGIKIKSLLPESTHQNYTLIPLDPAKDSEFTLPMCNKASIAVADVRIAIKNGSVTVSVAPYDDRTVFFKSMLHFYASLDELTYKRIHYRYRGYALDKPISLKKWAGEKRVYCYLRLEGVFDGDRKVNTRPSFLPFVENDAKFVQIRDNYTH